MKYKNIDRREFNDLIKKDDHVVLDVRTLAEFKQGAIPGAKHFNFYEASFEMKAQKLDRSKVYLVYCRSGIRSRQVCEIMAVMGFDKLYNLKGGNIMYSL